MPNARHEGKNMSPDEWDLFIDARRVAAPATREPELLFEFVRASDRSPMAAWLKFRGESYGREAQLLVRGELFISHSAFMTRAAAIAWAESERRDFEKGGV